MNEEKIIFVTFLFLIYRLFIYSESGFNHQTY